MSEGEYRAELRWSEQCNEQGEPQKLIGDCRARIIEVTGDDERTVVEFVFQPIDGDPADLDLHLGAALNAYGWRRVGKINSYWSDFEELGDATPAQGTCRVERAG